MLISANALKCQNKSLSFVNCERARVERTGAVLSLLSEATISQSGLVTGDVLIPEDTTAMVVEETPSGELNEAGVHSAGQADERVMFYRLVIKSGCFPKSAFEAVVVAAHYYLLSYTDLVCIAEVPSNVPGFAPSVRGTNL